MDVQTIALWKDDLSIDEIKYSPKGGATLKITFETNFSYTPREMQMVFEFDPIEWDNKIQSEHSAWERKLAQREEGLKFDDQEERDKITAQYKEKIKDLEKKKANDYKKNPSFTIKPTLKSLADKTNKTTLEVRLSDDDADTLWSKRLDITRFAVTFSEKEESDE